MYVKSNVILLHRKVCFTINNSQFVTVYKVVILKYSSKVSNISSVVSREHINSIRSSECSGSGKVINEGNSEELVKEGSC